MRPWLTPIRTFFAHSISVNFFPLLLRIHDSKILLNISASSGLTGSASRGGEKLPGRSVEVPEPVIAVEVLSRESEKRDKLAG